MEKDYYKGLEKELALATDDRVIVLDGDSCVHMFSEHGDHLSQFKLPTDLFFTRRIAFHHSSEHVVVAHVEADLPSSDVDVGLYIYTKDGELVRSTQTRVHGIHPLQRRMIVTAEGHVALIGGNPVRVFIVC